MLGIEVRDSATSKPSSLYKILDIDGITVTLQTKTSKEAYLNTEAITAMSTVANGQLGIDAGSLKVAVVVCWERDREFSTFPSLGGMGSCFIIPGVSQ